MLVSGCTGKSEIKTEQYSPHSEATTTCRTTNAGLKEHFTTDVLPSSEKRLPLCAYRRLRGLIGHYADTIELTRVESSKLQKKS